MLSQQYLIAIIEPIQVLYDHIWRKIRTPNVTILRYDIFLLQLRYHQILNSLVKGLPLLAKVPLSGVNWPSGHPNRRAHYNAGLPHFLWTQDHINLIHNDIYSINATLCFPIGNKINIYIAMNVRPRRVLINEQRAFTTEKEEFGRFNTQLKGLKRHLLNLNQDLTYFKCLLSLFGVEI